MSSFGDIVFSPVGIFLRVFAMLIVIGQIGLTVNLFLYRSGVLRRILSFVQLSAGLIWFLTLLDGSFYMEYAPVVRSYPPFVDLVYAGPWLIVLAVDLALAAVLCLSFVSSLRYRRTHLSKSAVKETLDLLPVGICFAQPDGVVALKNLKIDSLSKTLLGKPLVDASRFWQAIEEKGELSGGAWIVSLMNGEMVMLQKDTVTSNGKEYRQITARDVTEQYRIIDELRSKNKKLTDIHTRLKSFNARASQLAMDEEILKARVTVHDEMGHLLLAGKYYLNNSESLSAQNLLETERYTHNMLMREGEGLDGAKTDEIGNAVNAARVIGVNVKISGAPPENKTARDIIGQAIRECASNVAKHANGDFLDAAIQTERDRLIVTLRGNGNAPAEPITESGGLLMLRSKAESAGGEMDISYSPRVIVTITLYQ